MTTFRSLIEQRDFRRYWIARVFTAGAYQMQTVAVGWQMYDLTRSALDLGLVGLAHFIPRLLLTLPAGELADRWDRRRIVAICQLVEAIAMLTLALGSVFGLVGREALFMLAVVIGSARTFEMPTTQALLPSLVPTALFPQAVALSASAMQAATILGPALGGLLYVFGPTTVYGVCGGLFLVAAVLVSTLHPAPRKAAVMAKGLGALLAGIRFIRGRPVVLGAISLDLFAVLLGGATALLPIYARDILHTGPLGLGLLNAAPAVGALIVSVWLAHFPLRARVGRTMFIAVAVFGLATLVFAVSQVFVLSLAALLVLGASDMISVVIRQSLVQLETPDEMRGRVSAVNSIFIGASNQLGEFESGVTAALFGVVPAVVLGGVGTLLVAGLWLRLFPELAQRDRLTSEPH